MKLKQLTLAWLLSLGLTAYAANTKTTVTQVTEGVTLTDDVDYIVSSTTPFTTTGSVNIENTDHAVLILSSIKPSKVLSSWMDYIYINGEKAVDGTNCQVKMYSRGTIVFPYASNIRPLTCYTEQNYEGESCSNYSEGSSGGFMKTLNASLLNNQIRSFKLKRGYMVTFAIGTGGWGYSRCFIADQADLEVATLPAVLDKKISSYRIFKWQNFSKSGLANNTGYEATQALNVTGCYSFGNGESRYPDTECVPHHIYEDWPSASSCGSVTYSCHMKTNNEPGNSADDHPQDVETVLNNWENLMRTGMRLCSESSHDGSMSHLKSFIEAIDARGWRCDILDLHCYWDTGFGNLEWYSNNYGNGRPIWISEWIWGASWNSNGAFASGRTDAQVLSRTKEILESLNANSRVERYFYWNSESKAHIYENGALTELGKYYASMNTGLGYNAANEYIPKAPSIADLSELSAEYSRAKKTVTLSWSDPNGELSETITIQCKRPESSTWTDVATVTPKDKTSKDGASYTYTDEVEEPGVHTYRIKAISYTNKTLTTDEVIVNVAPAQGTDAYQYGKLSIDDAEENAIYFSETFAETPCVFIGAITNNNTAFYAGNNTKKGNKAKEFFTYTPVPWQGKTGTISKTEEVPFLALPEGNYHYGDLDCEVGLVTANKASSEIWTDVTEVVFTQPFPEDVTPVVLTEIRDPSYATSSTSPTSLSVRVFDVTHTGFKFIIYSEDASARKIAIAQKVCYLAITPGFGAIDEENGIIIAAGQGVDNPIYGQTARENAFYLTTNDEEGNPVNEPISLYNPTILAALQTNNYPTVCMLRRSNITEKDEEGTSWVTGIRVKRLLDHDITVDDNKISSTSTSDKYSEYRDHVGWVAITSNLKRANGEKTAIGGVQTQPATGTPRIIDGRVYVAGATTVEIYNLAGTKMEANSVLAPGIYVVKAHGKTSKILVK